MKSHHTTALGVGECFVVILFLTRLIASSGNGDSVSTNRFLSLPANSDQIPALGTEKCKQWFAPTEQALPALCRAGGLQLCFLCARAAPIFLSPAELQLPRHRSRVSAGFSSTFYFPWCFSHCQAVSCFQVQTWRGAELFQNPRASLARLFSSEMNYGIEIQFYQWAVKIWMLLV